jgi:hypothetical protein
LERIGLRFRKAVTEFAAEHNIAVIRFAKGQRKLEVMRPYLQRLERQGRTGVAAIGVAQEFQRVFTGATHHADEGGGGVPHFSYAKADRRVTAYYFYLIDEVFGPAFVKVCAYFPYPTKIWLNGHEYAKRQAAAAGIAFTELDNGFATTDDPARLHGICDTLSAGVIRVFCERWWARLPLPLTDADRAAGYWWDIAMRQVDVSRTIVFDAPRHARGFSKHCAPTTSTSAGRSRCRSSSAAGWYRTRGRVSHPAAAPRRRGHPQCLLPALASQVLPQVRHSVSHRNGHQQHRRPRSAPWPDASGGIVGQSP